MPNVLDLIAVVGSWLPLWVWIALAALAAGAIAKFVRVVGWRGALTAAVAVLSIGALGAARRKGWEDREKEGRSNVEKVLDQARAARDKSRVDNLDPDRLRDDDGYRRD